MATRKQAREAVIQLLYARDLGNDHALDQAHLLFEEQKIRNKQQEFAFSLLRGVCVHEEKIMQIMNVFLRTWNIDRLGVVERGILKLGIYELLYTDTQKAVIINEAIELAKSFGLHDAFRLVNGVLDAVAKTSIEEIEIIIRDYQESLQKFQDSEENKKAISLYAQQDSDNSVQNDALQTEQIEEKHTQNRNMHSKSRTTGTTTNKKRGFKSGQEVTKKLWHDKRDSHYNRSSSMGGTKTTFASKRSDAQVSASKKLKDFNMKGQNISAKTNKETQGRTFRIDKGLFDAVQKDELNKTNKPADS